MFSALKSRLVPFFFCTLLFTFSFLALPHQAAAVTPNTDPDVPKNSHTYTQTVLIDVISALSCQIAGIDPVDPNTPCLTINPETHKIGYAPQNDNQLGGMIGILSDQIGVLYTPPAGSGQYVSYLASNFGIVKPAFAGNAVPQCTMEGGNPRDGVGFCSLQPIFQLWKITLNIAYLLLVLVFIFIGLAVMLRIKIDPRTIMTVQNQIPRVVICILLITLSYGMAGFMIDMMWTSTYVGINAILQGPQDVELPGNSGNNDTRRLSSIATTKLLDTPISYFNQVLRSQDDGAAPNSDDSTTPRGFSGGIFHVTQAVSKALGGLVRDVITQLLGGRDCSPVKAGLQVVTLGIFGSNEVKDCASEIIGKVFGFLANIISWLIILCAILISLFRIWFKLLVAYIHILFYVIAAPIWIAMGLIPGRPLGFENWIRNLFANMAVFPLTAFLFVAARILMDTFNVQDNQALNPSQQFIPPLVGNPNMEVFGTLLAFGIILMAPGLLDLLKEKMKAQGTKIGGLATATMVAATGAATAVPKRQWASLSAKDQYGNATGPISSMQQNASRKFMTAKYAPQNWMATYRRTKDKKEGNTSDYMSWGEKHQLKKDRSRLGYGRTLPGEYEEKMKKMGINPDEARSQRHPEGPNIMGGMKRAAGPQGEDTVSTQAQQQIPGQRQGPPPETGGTINKGQPKPPIMPGGAGAAKALPEKPGEGLKDFKGDSALINKGPLQTNVGNVAPKTEGWKDASRMGQPNKPGAQQVGSLKVGTLTTGTLNVKGGMEGKHEPPPGIAPIIHPFKEGLKDAGHSVGEGWKNMGKAENEMIESARMTAPQSPTESGAPEAPPEVGRQALARDIAHQQHKIEEGREGSEGNASAPTQHGAIDPATGQHVTHEDIERTIHTRHIETTQGTKPAEGGASHPPTPKPDEHKEK